MLVDVLDTRKTQYLPACADIQDKSGSKRLEKLNTVLQKSSPLKPWTLRNHSNKVNLKTNQHNQASCTVLVRNCGM